MTQNLSALSYYLYVPFISLTTFNGLWWALLWVAQQVSHVVEHILSTPLEHRCSLFCFGSPCFSSLVFSVVHFVFCLSLSLYFIYYFLVVFFLPYPERFEDTKGLIRICKWILILILCGRRTDNTMAKRKRTKRQTPIYQTLHRKLKIE